MEKTIGNYQQENRFSDVMGRGVAHPPFRLWMTGSLAVVSAALWPRRDAGEFDRSAADRVLRKSPYSVSETVRRIEQAAMDEGLSVLVRLGGAQPVIVLASSVGGTPVVMDDPDSQPDVPLSVKVRKGALGDTEVLIAQSPEESGTDWHDLPDAVADDMAALPRLLDRALA
jgi:uncharacterized protein (DUF302 family)